MNTTISTKVLKAALNVTPIGDVRYFLNGVYVEKRGKVLSIAATNGHSMFLCREHSGDAHEPDFEVIIPRAMAQIAIKEYRTIGYMPIGKNEHEVWALGATLFTPIDGKYPNYKKVIPPGELSGEAAQFDPRNLLAAYNAVKEYTSAYPFLKMNGEGAAAYTASGCECVCLVMPMRQDSFDISPVIAPFQEWAQS